MNTVALTCAFIFLGGVLSASTGNIPATGFLSELIWAGLALAGLIAAAGLESPN